MDPATESFIDALAAVGARPLAVLLLEFTAEDHDLAARLRLMAAVHQGRDAMVSAAEQEAGSVNLPDSRVRG